MRESIYTRMELRKIQKTGGSSYIISLPKAWVTTHGLKEKDTIGIITRDDENLIVVPRVGNEHALRVKTINVDKIDDKRFLFRLLIGSYINGYNIIQIRSAARLGNVSREVARQFVQEAIGLEIIEEKPNLMTLKDLLNPSEMSFDSWIDRISQLVSTQMDEAMHAVSSKNAQVCDEIVARDKEVNRINWLISRKHNIMSHDIVLSEMLGRQDPGRKIDWAQVSRVIERVGDHVVQIAINTRHLLEQPRNALDARTADAIQKAGRHAIGMFKVSVGSLVACTLNEANDNIEKFPALADMCASIERIAIESETVVGIAIGNIGESIRRIGEYSTDLFEHIINNLIDVEFPAAT